MVMDRHLLTAIEHELKVAGERVIRLREARYGIKDSISRQNQESEVHLPGVAAVTSHYDRYLVETMKAHGRQITGGCGAMPIPTILVTISASRSRSRVNFLNVFYIQLNVFYIQMNRKSEPWFPVAATVTVNKRYFSGHVTGGRY